MKRLRNIFMSLSDCYRKLFQKWLKVRWNNSCLNNIFELPRYQNIRVSLDVKTTKDALKRAQVVIRMHSENYNQNLDGVATVSFGKESKQD